MKDENIQNDPSQYDLPDTSLPLEGPNKEARWIGNDGEAIERVFGFNQNAELVNGRAAMFGFLMLVLTELILGSQPVTKSIFGIG
tara:strand:- start:616 stop:870 length:255 start_codon:yes stop_codon:yes gene_type:complete